MPGPMRLLWMTEHYHPGAGGMAQSCDRIVHGLRRSGIAIDVAYLVAADSGIYVRAVERSGGRDIQVAAGGDRGVALNALHAWLSAGGARYDWVAAFGGHLPVLAAPTFAAWFGARLAVLLRGNDFDAGIFSPQKRPHLLEALVKADVVCGVSRDKVEKVTALFPYQNALHTPNGIDLARWSILPSQAAWAQAWRARNLPEGGVAIGLVGHLKPKKGLSFFLDALRASHAAERLHLMVVGSLDEAVAEQLAAHRATIRYSFFPFCERGRLPRHLAACDFLALPSFTDGMPNLLLEAGGLGVPILGAMAGGIPDVVRDPEHGILFPPGDRSACLEAIRRAADAALSGEAKAQGQRLRARIADEFSEAAETARYARILTKHPTPCDPSSPPPPSPSPRSLAEA